MHQSREADPLDDGGLWVSLLVPGCVVELRCHDRVHVLRVHHCVDDVAPVWIAMVHNVGVSMEGEEGKKHYSPALLVFIQEVVDEARGAMKLESHGIGYVAACFDNREDNIRSLKIRISRCLGLYMRYPTNDVPHHSEVGV